VSAAQNYSQAVKENNYWPLKVTLTRRNWTIRVRIDYLS
jgi:hypothetical protein